jgi:competence protein ComEA
MKKWNGIVAMGLAVVFALMANVGTALAAAKPAPTSKVNVNTATAEQFAALPGVGPKLGARIVEYRQKAGGSFKSVQELMNVRGIGEKNFAKLQAHVTTGEAAPARTGR